MRLLYGCSDEVADWVARRIPFVSGRMQDAPFGQAFGPCKATGVVDGAGNILGGVVYHNWDPRTRSIELSCAAETHRWLTRRTLRALLAYPFDDLNCNRCTVIVPKRSREVRRFLDNLGFKREGVVRYGFGDDDALIQGMLQKEWRQSRFLQPRQSTAKLLPAEAPKTTAMIHV